MNWLPFALFVLYQLSVTTGARTVDVFEFGNNVGTVSFTKTGKISLLDKNVKVPIVLPPCMDLRYVRVNVDNKRGPPKVDFDADVTTVSIRYRRLQYSKSTFTVVAKAVPMKNCKSEDDYDYE
ncbi:unnamed protein product [Leptosia nina]|uniref:Uncharacterized protein n=1 Tax=Leptosia nina TaxID=320188 RepID=A0AAV1J903_9NEOP